MTLICRVLLTVLLVVLAGAAPARAQQPGVQLFEEVAPLDERRVVDHAVAATVTVQASAEALTFNTEPARSINLDVLSGAGGRGGLVARLIRTETLASGRVAWFGALDGLDMSAVTLIVDEAGGITGTVTYPGAIFSITHLGRGTHAIDRIDRQAIGPVDLDAVMPRGSLDSSEPSDAVAPGSDLPTDDSGARIDVLVVYTPAARAAAGSSAAIQSLIDLEMAQANQSFINSGVTTRFRLVRTAEVAYAEAGIVTDLERLRLNGDGYADAVHALRDEVRADVVGMVLEERDGVACGIAADILQPSVAEAAKAFQVSARRCLGRGIYLLAHEFGHLMGARHDWGVDPTNNAPYSFNHGFVSPQRNWHTIMAYPDTCGGCTAVQYWSNPDLALAGVPLGIAEGRAGAADNRKTLNLMAPYVANFRQEAGGTPGAATPGSPRGATSSTRPTFSWNAVGGATYYYLWVEVIGGSPLLQQWYTSAAAGCTAQACWVTPALTLTAGRSYRWWIQTWNPSGYGPWSAPADFSIANAPASATVLSLWQVPDTRVGGTARLWARVRNNGGGALPAGSRVWFWVTGPGWSGDNYVGSVSVASIQPGTAQWAMFDWTLAAGRAPGTYTYYARVFDGSAPLSPWSSGQSFTVLATATASAAVVNTWPIGTAVRGTAVDLWARVRNTGTTALPAGSNVRFWVAGPSGTGSWVGGTVVAGLAPAAEQWYRVQWTPAANAPTGGYTYWAQVWSATAAISAWSQGQPFPVQ